MGEYAPIPRDAIEMVFDSTIPHDIRHAAGDEVIYGRDPDRAAMLQNKLATHLQNGSLPSGDRVMYSTLSNEANRNTRGAE
ncbi:hypothetical protein A2773_02335 [Candidatus Gottesmanbacteria bacterium RIFCSPHIGHO2_01_FULL_39_10]|uniref:Uncharacterized protein n=1 Tax=Candidatus Gottesmanbacteria bacterium RIFCSPHIGHO2_01_FULL_39_10 TaxID=1798375 RepID=A0A1F5ZR82_9BACT|nr:MAG: hypothetical protein A2773_02335 [Candidatus Gottesmanbacteria bacterium RIFCSPHIGHO2_01_FULL_39_10]